MCTPPSPTRPAGLARTLLRLHADRGLAIDVNVPAGLAVRCQREDLDEMLGNLLDNACKWAKSRVVLSVLPSASARGRRKPIVVEITVDDDGPGLDPSMREAVLQRGVRVDEAAPGSGLGLAIVRELAELYGGSIALGAVPRRRPARHPPPARPRATAAEPRLSFRLPDCAEYAEPTFSRGVRPTLTAGAAVRLYNMSL